MDHTLANLRKIAPELVETLHKRYELLQAVDAMAPVGRRALAERVGMTERMARSECDHLREYGLLAFEQSGMRLTEEGLALLEELKDTFEAYFTDGLRTKLRRALHMNEILILPGDASRGVGHERALGKRTAQYLHKQLHDGMTLAIMGGATIAAVARQMRAQDLSSVTVLPARGGLGEDMNLQANAVAAAMAEALGANYKILHLSDDMPADSLPPAARGRYLEWLGMMEHADILLYGIGRADKMAIRRGISREVFQHIRQSGAVAEALGYYFDRQGKIVHAASELTVDLDVFSSIPVRIAVAGGTDKAEAILAVIRGVKPTALILDEAAAGAMCVLLDSGQ